MTGQHIQKISDHKWTYLNHEKLLKKCKLFPMDIYLERRRGTLRDYFNKYRSELLNEMQQLPHHCYAANQKFWWEQSWINKKSMIKIQKQWYPD